MEEYKKDDRGRSKAQRLTKNDPQQKVDSSTWTPSAPENAGVKTGARPLTKRLYKKGGKVIGKDAMKRADRKPRKAGGRAEHKAPWVDDLINRDVRMANDKREGVKHEGAFKKGGKTHKASGGKLGKYMNQAMENYSKAPNEPKNKQRMADGVQMAASKISGGSGAKIPATRKSGGKIHKLGGGMVGDNPISMQNRSMSKATGMMKKGGRTKKRADGGDVIGDMIRQDQIEQGMKGRGQPARVPTPPRRPADAPPAPYKGPIPAAAKQMGAKKGGKIEHSDEAQDKKLMHKVLKPKAFKAEGGSAHGKDCGCKMCSGGRTMKYAGGGVFSGNSKEKVPGATGGRHARAAGGGFAEAFKAGRAAMLSGGPKTFEYNGKQYSTDLAPAAKSAGRGNGPSAGNFRDSMPPMGPQERIVGTELAPPQASQQAMPGMMGRGMGPATHETGLFAPRFNGQGEPGISFSRDVPNANAAPIYHGGDSTPQMSLSDLGENRGGRTPHKAGGRTKAGKTTINIVMGGHGQQPQSMPNAPVQPPRPPMGVPVPPPQMAGGAPPMAAGAPPMPPQMPGRATGGRTGKMVGGSLGNAMGYGQQPAMGGYGQLQQQQPMMGGVGQQGMMPRKSGGRTNYPIDTGAGGANARLEKIDAYGLKPSKRK